MNKADEENKHIIDEITAKIYKEINSLDKARKEGIQLQCFAVKSQVEQMADRIGVSRDALLMTFADLLLEAAVEIAKENALDRLSRMAKEQENAELQELAERLVRASMEFDRGNKVKRKPPKGGYIQ